jgi:isopentenyldiphosphate isomerase
LGGTRKYSFPSFKGGHKLTGIVDYIIIIIADVSLDVNPNEARDTRYVSPEELKEMFKQPGISTFFEVSDFFRSPIHAVVQIDLSKVSV